jgi:hypothetical protein
VSPLRPWRVAGRYFESCNCDAICPCRMVGGRPGGRSTHGICFGALSWLVDEGHAGDTDLSELAAVLVYRYDDDEQGSPWSFVVHVDERGSNAQRDVLTKIFTGQLGGERVLGLPWVRKASELLEVRISPIAIEHGAAGYTVRVGEAVSVNATRRVASDVAVACIVPGYDRPGSELTADGFSVRDTPFEWELVGNCAFASQFDYTG